MNKATERLFARKQIHPTNIYAMIHRWRLAKRYPYWVNPYDIKQ